jgi:hypothetical protein
VQAEKILLDELNSGKSNKEYLPVTGLQAFLDVTSQVKTLFWEAFLHSLAFLVCPLPRQR